MRRKAEREELHAGPRAAGSVCSLPWYSGEGLGWGPVVDETLAETNLHLETTPPPPQRVGSAEEPTKLPPLLRSSLRLFCGPFGAAWAKQVGSAEEPTKLSPLLRSSFRLFCGPFGPHREKVRSRAAARSSKSTPPRPPADPTCLLFRAVLASDQLRPCIRRLAAIPRAEPAGVG